MQKELYTYALVRALYEQEKDILDTFEPFVIRCFPSNRHSQTINSIEKMLRDKFKIDMPAYVVEKIIYNLSKKGYIEKLKDEGKKIFSVTEKGIEYLNKLETERDVERRINELLKELKRFLEERGIKLDEKETEKILIDFLSKNSDLLMNLFIFQSQEKTIKILNIPLERIIIEYILKIEKNAPILFKTLNDIFLGSVLCRIIKEGGTEQYTTDTNFKNCGIYLDTNFILFILDCYYETFCEPSKELLKLIKDAGFKIKVFDFTIDEICRLLNGYIFLKESFPSSIPIDSIYSYLRGKGWTKEDIKEFITSVDEKIENMGIEIERTNLNLEKYNPPEGYENMDLYKPYQPIFSRKHDIAAIEKIKEYRDNKRIRKLTKTKAIFLSCDVGLSQFTLVEFGHKKNGTIPEVILDRILAIILWLRKPKIETPLKSLVAALSRNLFVNRKVWERFYEVLQGLINEEKLKQKDVVMLFYHKYIEDVLLPIDEKEINKITPEFVLKTVEEAVRQFEKKEKEHEDVKDKIKELEENLSRLLKREEERDKETAQKINTLRETIKEAATHKAGKKAKRWTIFLLAILDIFIGVMIYKLFSYLGLLGIELLGIIFSILGVGGMIGLNVKMYKFLNSKLFNKFYNENVREFKLFIDIM